MKKLLVLLAALVSIFVGILILVMLVIDPNDYKVQIETQAKDSLDRTLVLDGDLSWSFFPNIGIVTENVRIENPKGFNRANLMEVAKVEIGVKMLPLLTGDVELGQLSFHGFRLNVVTNRDGKSNLDGIGDKGQASSEQDNKDTSEQAGVNLNSLSLAGISILDAQIEVQDWVNNTHSLLNIKELTLGEFELGASAPLKVVIDLASDTISGEFLLSGNVLVNKDFSQFSIKQLAVNSLLSGSALPNGDLSIDIGSAITVELDPMRIAIDDISLNANDIQLSGHANLAMAKKTKVRFDLTGNVWDLEQFVSDQAQATPSEQDGPSDVEPDLSFLNGLDVDGQLTIAGMKVNGLTLGKTVMHTVVKNGVAKLAPLKAQLYDGSVTVNAQVVDGHGQNSYAVTKEISGISLQPLLKDLADTGLLAGTTNFTVKVSGQGLSVDKIKKNMVGNGRFEILDGALYGVNIPQKIRTAKAALTGGDKGAADTQQKTDFTALTGDFSISDGIVNNSALTMAAPFLRLDGNGVANIIDSTLDYRLKAILVGTSKGQGGATDKGGLTLPLKITGTFSEPKYSLDTSGALKAKIDQEKEKAKEKLKDKLKDKLGDLFK